MNNLSSLIAARYLHHTRSDRSTSAMVRICFMSILIGAFSLTLVTAIQRGFEVTIHEKIQGINAPATIDVEGDQEDAEQVAEQLRSLKIIVKDASISATTHALIITQEGNSQPIIVGIKGIDPEHEIQVSSIAKKLITQDKKNTQDTQEIKTKQADLDAKTIPVTQDKQVINQLADILVKNNVIIGVQLAQNLGLKEGDTFQLSYVHKVRASGKKLLLGTQEARVGGLFKTGIDELDTSLIYASLPFIDSFESTPPQLQVGISFHDGINEEDALTKINSTLITPAHSWKERYSSLVAALILEKYAMFFIIALITLVASMNIISLLFMQITNKQSDIAILKAMGMRSTAIRSIFLKLGLGIAACAAFTGILLACGAVALLKYYPIITLPDCYHTSHLPVHLDWFLPPLVFGVVILISTIATWFPSRRINTINITHVLRFEG